MDLICRWAVWFNICLIRLKMQMTQRMTVRATQRAAVGCYMVLLQNHKPKITMDLL